MDFIQSIGILDIIFIAILAISTLVGLIRGGFREILSLVGLAAALYCAFKFSDMISEQYVSQFFEQARISYIISFIAIIVVVIFIIALVNLLISQLLKASGLSFINRFLGMLFGIVRGGIISSIIVFTLNFIPGISKETWWTKSSMVPFFKTFSLRSYQYLPKNIADYFQSTTQEISKVAGETFNSAVVPKNTTPSQKPITDNTKSDVDMILKSIDNSNQETVQPKIQLESTTDAGLPPSADN
ncbi:MAG: CvpA family protein [Ostreibacterium sp.]